MASTSTEAQGGQIRRPFRILSLDGGGAKGFYTLGVLSEIEAMTGKPLHASFDLIFGTSTGSIIAALLARGETVASVLKLYSEHVPTVMKPGGAKDRSEALQQLAKTIFKDTKVTDFKRPSGLWQLTGRTKDLSFSKPPSIRRMAPKGHLSLSSAAASRMP